MSAIGHVPELQQSRRFAIAIAFACSTPIKSRLTVSDGGPPCAAKPLLFTRWDNPLLYAWARRANGCPPRRHIGVTCGDSRTPKLGRCSRERRLNRSVTGRRGLLTRPSLLFLRWPFIRYVAARGRDGVSAHCPSERQMRNHGGKRSKFLATQPLQCSVVTFLPSNLARFPADRAFCVSVSVRDSRGSLSYTPKISIIAYG